MLCITVRLFSSGEAETPNRILSSLSFFVRALVFVMNLIKFASANSMLSIVHLALSHKLADSIVVNVSGIQHHQV